MATDKRSEDFVPEEKRLAEIETTEQLRGMEEKILSEDNQQLRQSVACRANPPRSGVEPREALRQLEHEVVHEKGMEVSRCSMISLPSQHSSNESQKSGARQAVEELEASPSVPPLVAKEARAALLLLESKSVTLVEREKQLMEAKSMSCDSACNSSGGTARDQMITALSTLESKVTGDDSTHQAGSAATEQTRVVLCPVESKFTTANESNPPPTQPGEALRRSLHQLESKFTSYATPSSVVDNWGREVVVGAVAVTPGAVSQQDRTQAKLESELGSIMQKGGTTTAADDAPAAASSLREFQGKAPTTGSPDASAADRLESVEQKMLVQNAAPSPSSSDSIHDDLERRLNTLEEKAEAANPTGLQQHVESAEETLEHNLLDKYGQEGKGQALVALENTMEETAFAASRRGDGNVGAFANEPADALPGHCPRNPRPHQVTNEQQSSSNRGVASTETSGHFQIEAGVHELDSEEGLAKAILVKEDEEHLPVGVPEDNSVDTEKKKNTEEKRNLRDRLTKLGLICCMIVVIVVVVSVVVAVQTTDNDSRELPTSEGKLTKSPTEPPSVAPTPYILSLPDYTLLALEDPESPQSQAYRWLGEDPSLEDYTDDRISQRMALATIFYATNGDEWTLNSDWLSYDVDECFWFSKFNINSDDHSFKPPALYFYTTPDQLTGVPICDEEGNYLALVLSQNGLAGTFPQEVSMLTNLELLALANNEELAGRIPTEIGLLTNIKELDLGNTKVTGSIPSEIGWMTNLKYLILREVPISGSLPSEIGRIDSLKELEVMRTDITGTIPIEYYSLKNITFFGLYRNKLTGYLPTEIRQLADSVKIFRVDDNRLTGTIPTEIGLLTKMTNLHVNHNQMTGIIPSELGNLKALEQLWLQGNFLTSTLPAELGTLSNMTVGTFSEMLVTGTVPLSIWLLPKSFGPDISRNPFLEGSIPTEIGVANKFFALFAYDMGPKWGGTIPSEIGLQTNLLWAVLENANVEGTIPTGMANLVALEDLILAGNPLLTGTLPEAIGKLPRLGNVSLVGTQLTGPLPDEMCSIDILKFDCLLMCGCHCPCTNETLQLADTRSSQQNLR